MKKLTVLWNFTAFHESVMEMEYGAQWHRKMSNGTHPEAIDIRAIMELAEQTGQVDENIAYGDWQHLSAYATILREYNVRLIQFFPQPRGRQDAVSEELIEDAYRLLAAPDAADQVLLIGGNSKFIDFGRKIKSDGTKLVICGIASPTEREWEEQADEFIAYRDIARPMQGDQQNFKEAKDTHEALIKTFVDLRNQYGHEWIRQVKVKPVLLRHLPEFVETEYGYSSFGAYLGDQREILERRQPRNAKEAEYALVEEVIPEDAVVGNSPDADPASLIPYYLRVAAQQGVRMPPPEIMWVGIDIYASFLESEQVFGSFNDLDDECLHMLKQDVKDASLTDAKKVRQVLFKCYLFRPSKDGTIGFQDEVKGLEDIEDRYFRLMLARIGNNVKAPVNYETMSLALTGDAKSAKFLEDLHSDLAPED